MAQKKVVILKTNLLDIDPRMRKTIGVLKRQGYSITLLCWDRNRLNRKKQLTTDYTEIQFNFKAPIGTTILFFLPFWWIWLFFKLVFSNYDVIHAINFDTVVPAVLASKISRRKLIYEIFDVYADNRVLPGFIRKMGVKIEKLFIRFCDGVILANEGHPDELEGVPNRNVVQVLNSPPDSFGLLNPTHNDIFTLFFAGSLQSDRHTNLDKVCQVIRETDGARLVIAGYGDTVPQIEDWVKTYPTKVTFLGVIDYQDVIKLTLECDLIFALYDPVVPTVKYAGGNKMFEAMMAGKPYLVSDGTVMADIVRRENCGIAVNCNNISDIKQGILKLKSDPDLCRLYGANGRKAYETKYNLTIMEKRLVDFYSQITGPGKNKK